MPMTGACNGDPSVKRPARQNRPPSGLPYDAHAPSPARRDQEAALDMRRMLGEVGEIDAVMRQHQRAAGPQRIGKDEGEALIPR